MKSTLCILVLLVICAIVKSQVPFVSTCIECNECPGRCTSLQNTCASRFASSSCVTLRAPVPGVVTITGRCLKIADDVVVNEIQGSANGDCLMIGNRVQVRGDINLGGGNDYLVIGEDVRTKRINGDTGRDCISSGARFRTDGINLGPGNDQYVAVDVTTEVDGTGVRGSIEGEAGNDCIVIGRRTAKRTTSQLEAIFASFDEGPGKRATATGSSFVANVVGSGGRDCIKLYCTEFQTASGDAGPDCLDVQAARFHRVDGGAGNDNQRVDNFEAVSLLGVPGGIYGGDGDDTLQVSGARRTAIVDGSFSALPGAINRCCSDGGQILSRRCEQPLALPCVAVP